MAEKVSNRSASNSSTDSGSPQPHRFALVPHSLAGNLTGNWGVENSVSAIAPRNIAPVVLGSGRGNVDSLEKKRTKRSSKSVRGGNLSTGQRQFLQIMPADGGDGGSEMAAPPGFSSPQSGFTLPPLTPLFAPMGMGDNFSLDDLLTRTAGSDFTTHTVTVNIGEDVVAKTLSFSQNGTRGVCTLSATGDVSNVTLRQPISGGSYTHEGIFHILTLNGSFISPKNGGKRNRHGGELSVSLACNDGRVIGGIVTGPLWAASPIQLVVGSFNEPGSLPKKKESCSRKRKQKKDVPEQEKTGVVPAATQTSAGADGDTCVVPVATHAAAGTAGESSAPAQNEEQDQNADNPNRQHEKETESISNRVACPDINETVPSDECAQDTGDMEQ